MTVRLTLQWPGANGAHRLLDDAQAAVTVRLDGTPQPPVKTSPGAREFRLEPGGGALVQVEVEMKATFFGLTRTVLHADQLYRIDGPRFTAIPSRLEGAGHPLLTSAVVGNAVGAEHLIDVHTDFVDVTDFMFEATKNAPVPYDAATYQAERSPAMDFVALGCTSARPLLWYASFPRALTAVSGKDLGCLVFYRPYGYPYAAIDAKTHKLWTNRYLLSRVAGSNDIHRADRILRPTGQFIRSDFERAILNSGKRILMLHPWPSELNFFKSATAELPPLARKALRFLVGANRIGENDSRATVGRLGLYGYSAGGLGMWNAFDNASAQVDELYIGDATYTRGREGAVVAWMKGDPGRRVRMAAAVQERGAGSLRSGLQRAGIDPQRFSIDPRPADYTGRMPLWEYMKNGIVNNNQSARHQYCLTGSYPGNALPPHHITWLGQWLKASKF